MLRPKLAKWLCLCECYPYRMSFLVLMITDLVQKEMVNRLRRIHPSLQTGYKLVHYGRGKANNAVESLELPDNMPIAEAYFRHVERYIYSHPTARKMLSLDGDPVRERDAAVRHPPPSGAQFIAPLCLRRSCSLLCSSPRWPT